MNVGKPVGKMKSTESDVRYFEVDAVFNGSQWSCWRRVRGLRDCGELVTTRARRFCADWSLEMFF